MSDNTNNYNIDAKGYRLGKLATKVAFILQGKDTPDFERHLIRDVTVTIENASQLDIPENKKTEIYQSYSGYPGGRKTETLEHLAKRLGYAEVIKRTIGGMLPNNKHKKKLLAQLVINE